MTIGNIENIGLHVSPDVIKMIKKWEKFMPTAYLDPVGVWTIGYGHTKGVKRGDTITEEEASRQLAEEIEKYGAYIKQYVKVRLSTNQYSALTSWCYNVGPGNVKKSQLIRKLNRGNYQAVPGQLAHWRKGRVRGRLVVLRGLVTRRTEEAKIWSTPDDQGEAPEVVTECGGADLPERDIDNSPLMELTRYSRTFRAAAATIASTAGVVTAQFDKFINDPTMLVMVGIIIVLSGYIIYLKYQDIFEGVG